MSRSLRKRLHRRVSSPLVPMTAVQYGEKVSRAELEERRKREERDSIARAWGAPIERRRRRRDLSRTRARSRRTSRRVVAGSWNAVSANRCSAKKVRARVPLRTRCQSSRAPPSARESPSSRCSEDERMRQVRGSPISRVFSRSSFVSARKWSGTVFIFQPLEGGRGTGVPGGAPGRDFGDIEEIKKKITSTNTRKRNRQLFNRLFEELLCDYYDMHAILLISRLYLRKSECLYAVDVSGRWTLSRDGILGPVGRGTLVKLWVARSTKRTILFVK